VLEESAGVIDDVPDVFVGDAVAAAGVDNPHTVRIP
jgi:hypothetical protein